MPFSSGGISHIDFIVVEITDPARPGEKNERHQGAMALRRQKWLGLDIQVSRGSE
ncbi:MAG: hypothetical protein V1709_06070 [Planctomycetota bacterium]